MSLAGSNNQQNQNKKYLPKNESIFLILFLNYLLLFVIQMVIFDIDSWGEKI